MTSRFYMTSHSHNEAEVCSTDTSLIEKSIIFLLLGELEVDQPLETRYYRLSIEKLQQFCGQSIGSQELIEATQNILLRRYLIKDGKKMLSTSFISSATSVIAENMLEVGVGSMVYPYLLKLRERYLDSLTLQL